jgi:hypothetical protein
MRGECLFALVAFIAERKVSLFPAGVMMAVSVHARAWIESTAYGYRFSGYQ